MKRNYIQLIICYVFWGFQPLYWAFLTDVSPYALLGFRIIFAFLSSLLIVIASGQFNEFKRTIKDWDIMKYLLISVIFLAADWAVYLVAVQNGHILDTGLGYYLSPLFLFIFGVIIYKEKGDKYSITAIIVATVGVIVSALSLGKIPLLSLVVGAVWAIYGTIKKNVKVSGVLSITIETMIMTPFAIIFMIVSPEINLNIIPQNTYIFIILSGLVTAFPMFLYSNCVAKLPLIVMCFAQYLSPTFNMVSGFIRGESFKEEQLLSFAFFFLAIVIFTISEVKKAKKINHNNEITK